MKDYEEIDRAIFSGSDTPLDEKWEIYEWFKGRIQGFINGGFFGDRCFILMLEVMVAMLGTLSQRYGNSNIDRQTVQRWRRDTLTYFDKETEEAGDADSVGTWRRRIELNFDRLFEAVD